MFDSTEKRKEVGKWLIGIITCCILIYLGMRHISNIADAIMFLAGLAKPMLIGTVLALILNVPMSAIEGWLRRKVKLKRATRPLAIVLALILVLGIFVGVAVLVIPELINAVTLIVQIIGQGLDQLASMENDAAIMSSPLGKYLAGIDIDWLALKTELEEFIRTHSDSFVNQAVDATSSVAGGIVSLFIGFIFSIYILSGKEKLKRQVCRLTRVWLPQKLGGVLIHVCGVCSKTFRLFIAGQATEAIILGTLCMIGMAILRIPYAPMIGALIGVTALIPIVGAFFGTIVGAIMILTVNPFKAFVFIVFLLVLQQVEGNMIYPKVVGSKINLPAMWVLAAVTVGGNLGGPLGMLLGVPAASAAYALLREATQKRENRITTAPTRSDTQEQRQI